MSLFIATHTAIVDLAGKRVKIVKDATIARIGHAILNGNEHLFKPLHVHYDCEEPKPTPPPSPVPAKVVRAKTAAAQAATEEPAEEE